MQFELSLIIPGFDKAPLYFSEDFLAETKAAGLVWLLQRATKNKLTGHASAPDTMLLSWLQGTENLGGYANYLAHAMDLSQQEGTNLVVTPIYVITDHKTAYCTQSMQCELTKQEEASLLASLNDFLKEDGLLIKAHRGTWLLQRESAFDLKTSPLNTVMEKSLLEKLPDGAEGAYFRKLFTEIQMLLSNHPVNVARQESNMPEVSALWFWGEGDIETSSSLRPGDVIVSDSLLAEGFAKKHNMHSMNVPKDFSVLKTLEKKHVHVLLDDLYAPMLVSDERLWSHTLKKLEENWFLPIMRSFKERTINTVNIILANNLYELNYRIHKTWWRPEKSVLAYFES